MSGPFTSKQVVNIAGSVITDTDMLAEGVTNLYFTEARVRATVLTGLSTATATAILSTDTLLVALGKLQGQLNNISVTELSSINGTVAANDLTLTLFKRTLTFRNSSLTDGTPVNRTMGADITLVVPSGATLGAISNQLTRLYLIAIDNAGTVELAVANSAGGVQLNEIGLISTTAISAAADSNNVVYSTTARPNVAYRIVGAIEFTQVTAGTYATAPSLKQGAGGNALTAMDGVGYGQTVQNFTSSGRAIGTTYYNLTGKPIMLLVTLQLNAVGNAAGLTLDGQLIYGSSVPADSYVSHIGSLVPPGSSYLLTAPGGGSIHGWLEIR